MKSFLSTRRHTHPDCPTDNRWGCLVLAISIFTSTGQTAIAEPLGDMALSIENDLGNRCVGYGYVIYQNGNYVKGGGGGVAKLGDPNNVFDLGVPFDQNTVKDCHSISKAITATALTLALEKAGVSIDSSMWQYLPVDLQNANNSNAVKSITFRNLLAHRSGFSASTSYSWAQIRSQMQGGLPNAIGTYEYSNWNYAVCRVLIPFLIDNAYFRSLETSPNVTLADLDQATADSYINYVRQRVFAPAGLGTIHPRPVNSTLSKFAWYYDFEDLSVPAQLMPDRRLTVGSGGWAISARDYGKFISALFREEILSKDQLEELQGSDLAMFDRTGSNGSDVYFAHNGATSGNGVGGRSVWMAFPGDIQIVVQVNSINNSYSGAGVDLDRIVQEAYEHAFSTPPSSFSYPRHLFVHRAGDGWMTSRGVRNSGTVGARNFDFDMNDGAPALFTHHRFIEVASKTFLLRYNADNFNGSGRAIMHSIKADGTLGSEVFDNADWLSGWTNVETFKTFEGSFLLLHNNANGRIRTFKVSTLGTLGEAITDFNYTKNFDIVEILVLSGTSHLFRHNSSTGETHLRALNSDGSVGDTAYSDTWSTAFGYFEFYTAADKTFLFRHNPDTGKARINRIDGSLNNTPQILDATWSTGWKLIRFFETADGALFIRYNPTDGAMRMQEITSNGTPGDLVFDSESWLAAKESMGAFLPATTGWTDLEIYDATPGISSPGLDKIGNPAIPSLETGVAIDPVRGVSGDTTPIFIEQVLPKVRTVRGTPQIDITMQKGVHYFVERSADLKRWDVVDSVKGDASDYVLSRQTDSATGQMPPTEFYRVRSIENIPPLEPSRDSIRSKN
ncbi:MAG: CubicO group peptidase (beta-lactamase class C family) [Verrucomicrobiales bacterium]|jgi:CubicO group peptidase (beta-lactamase class C family)